MIAIEREAFSAGLFAEVLPLAQRCWDESTEAKGPTCAYFGAREFQVEPDMEAYQRIEDAGFLVVITLRDAGALKGYVVGVLYHSLHHKRLLCALGDSVYVEPDYRAYTGPLAERFEKEMRELGVVIIGWPVHVNGPVYPVLKARGYSGDETVMELRLHNAATI